MLDLISSLGDWLTKNNGWLSASAAILTAFATLAIAYLTASLAHYARRQIKSNRDISMEWKTVDVCGEYERNPVIEGAARRLSDGLRLRKFTGKGYKNREDWKLDDRCYYRDAIVILNYLDSIAIGIEQGLYDEGLARSHLEPIVKFHAKHFLHGDNKLDIDRTEFCRVTLLCEKWTHPTVEPKKTRGFRSGKLLSETAKQRGKDAGLDDIVLVLPVVVAIFFFWPAFQSREIMTFCENNASNFFDFLIDCKYYGERLDFDTTQSLIIGKSLAFTFWSIILVSFWKFETAKNIGGFFVNIFLISSTGLAMSQSISTIFLSAVPPDWQFHGTFFGFFLGFTAFLSLAGMFQFAADDSVEGSGPDLKKWGSIGKFLDRNRENIVDILIIVFKICVYSSAFWVTLSWL